VARTAIPSWFFVLMVVRQGDRFLLVQERKHGQTWYLPAGRVEPGETLRQAALRETWEEAGLQIELDGILRIEHSPAPDMTRVRVLFTAHPLPDAPTQTPVDSLQVRFVTLADLAALPLRGPDVRAIFEAVAAGHPVYPLSLICHEREAFSVGG
jgi:phosphatase NudJ